MKISVCTTTARRGYVELQAQLLAAQQLMGDTLEWVLVDFAYEERAESLKALAKDLRLELIHVPNVRDDQRFFRDITRNRNLALARSTGDVVIFLDDYAVIDPSWVHNHATLLWKGHLSAGNMYRLEPIIEDLPALVAQPFVELLEKYRPNIGLDYRLLRNGQPVTEPYKAIGISYTGNLGIPRGMFEHLNGFDPRMESGLEDCDFGMRAHMAGFLCFFNPRASTINLYNGHIPYTYSFDHTHDVEPFICNAQNKFWGDAKLPENEFLRIAFHDHYRIAHCKKCGAHGMVDPSELMQHTQNTKQYRVPSGLPGGLDTLRKAGL